MVNSKIISKSKMSNKPKITFIYNKADSYRNYHIDGIYGGLLPTGNIWFDPFVEKGLLPDNVVSEVNIETGDLTDIKKSPDDNNKILRELQSGFILNLSTAEKIRDWLDDKIKVIQQNTKTK